MYRILGPIEVDRGGAPVRLLAAKPRTLLLALLLRSGAMTSTDRLVDALWPQRPPPSATKLVQVYISQLRSVLGADAIETAGSAYRICLAAGDLDADVFEALHAQGRQALATGDYQRAHDVLGEALGLWRGPALADEADLTFAAQAGMRLEELRLACTEDRLDADLALGRHEALLPELAELCREHPLRERFRERLALALYRSGRQAEALSVLTDGRRALLEELGLDPDRALQELEHAILTQDPALDFKPVAPSPMPALPMPPNRLIGRKAELDRLTELVAREEVRIVTISGAGGTGKTRVVLELAQRMGPQFEDGAAVVALATVRDPQQVLNTIAQSIGLPQDPEEDIATTLVEWLASREVLLVIDNFEHLVEAGPVLVELTRHAPGLTVIVTSRRVLHISGEHVFPLHPLPADDAVRLFIERASALDQSIRYDEGSLAVLGEICERLDRLPLAVELAAARTAVLDPRELLARLSVSIGALGPGPRDAPARQLTLADTVRWSTDLLSDEERSAFAQLSVFVGGCSLEAAETVAGADLDALTGLLDASLLARATPPTGPRFSMLETIRLHAARLLDFGSGRDQVEAAHRAYFAELAASTPLKGPEASRGLALLDADLDNLRAAYDGAVSVGDDNTALRIAAHLYRYWYPRGMIREGRDRIKEPLDRGAGDPVTRALAHQALAGLEYLLGNHDAAVVSATEGVECGTPAGALDCVMGCYTVLGLVARRRGELDDARRHFESSGALAEELGLAADVVIANTNLGDVALAAGDYDEARRRWERTIELNRALGANDSYALLGLGDVAVLQDRLDDAWQHYERARAVAEEAGWPHNVAMALLGLASVAAHRGDVEDAGRLLGRVSALVADTTGEMQGTDADSYRDTQSAVLAAVGPTRLAELLEAGRTAKGEAHYTEP